MPRFKAAVAGRAESLGTSRGSELVRLVDAGLGLRRGHCSARFRANHDMVIAVEEHLAAVGTKADCFLM
jgi:hypothetical protein